MPKKKEENTEVVETPTEEAPLTEEAVEKPKKTPKEKFIFACKWFFLSYIWLFIVMFILDIVTKNVILNVYSNVINSGDYWSAITVIPNFLFIDFTINPGMAFGIDTNNELANFILFVTISLIGMIVILVIYGIQYKKLTPFVKACLMLLLAGCIGNLIDRSFYTETFYANHGLTSNRGVIDWISFKFGNWYFPTFNFADASLVVGAIMLIVWLFVEEGVEDRKKKKEEKAEQEAAASQNAENIVENNEGSTESSEVITESEPTDAPPEIDENKSLAEIENQENGEDSSK